MLFYPNEVPIEIDCIGACCFLVLEPLLKNYRVVSYPMNTVNYILVGLAIGLKIKRVVLEPC